MSASKKVKLNHPVIDLTHDDSVILNDSVEGVAVNLSGNNNINNIKPEVIILGDEPDPVPDSHSSSPDIVSVVNKTPRNSSIIRVSDSGRPDPTERVDFIVPLDETPNRIRVIAGTARIVASHPKSLQSATSSSSNRTTSVGHKRRLSESPEVISPPPPRPETPPDAPKCPVCIEAFSNIKKRGKKIVVTRCGHMFCDHCLQQSMKAAGRICPKCRKKIPKGPTAVIEIFDIC